MNDRSVSDDFVETLLSCALQHGENSDPDHEVGDLQSFFRASWSLMTADQRRRFYQVEEVYEILQGLDYEDILPEVKHVD